MDCKPMVLMPLSLVAGLCVNPEAGTDNNQSNYTFTGDWQGNGKDAEGNRFTFAARVLHSGKNRYRILILDKLDTVKDPIHIMDGVLENKRFIYTSDKGLYEGYGTISKDRFEGYYKGPVEGTYSMIRINCETRRK